MRTFGPCLLARCNFRDNMARILHLYPPSLSYLPFLRSFSIYSPSDRSFQDLQQARSRDELLRKTFRNPILRGFYPDPSICRVGEDFYLVTSTFEYFPGLPIFHSRDLVHWHQIGHVLDRPSQLPLDEVRPSGGLYAPTIRFSNDTFYVINTLVDGKTKSGNFIVTANDPAGPWS